MAFVESLTASSSKGVDVSLLPLLRIPVNQRILKSTHTSRRYILIKRLSRFRIGIKQMHLNRLLPCCVSLAVEALFVTTVHAVYANKYKVKAASNRQTPQMPRCAFRKNHSHAVRPAHVTQLPQQCSRSSGGHTWTVIYTQKGGAIGTPTCTCPFHRCFPSPPAVSTSRTALPPHVHSIATASRVSPGVGPVNALSC